MSGEKRTIIMEYQPWKLCGCCIRLRWLHWYSKDINCDDSVLANSSFVQTVEMIPFSWWRWTADGLNDWRTGIQLHEGQNGCFYYPQRPPRLYRPPRLLFKGPAKGGDPGAPWTTVQVNNARNDTSLPQKSYGVVLNEAEALPIKKLQLGTGLTHPQTVG